MSVRQVGAASSRADDVITRGEVQALIAAAGGGGGADVTQRPPNPIAPVGSWLWMPSVAVESSRPNNGEARLHPMWLPPATYDAVSWNVSNAGSTGAVSKVIVYGDSSGVPSGLLLDTAAVAADTATGSYQITGLSLVVASPGRLVWASVVNQGAPSTLPNLICIGRVGNTQPLPASALGLQFTNNLPGGWQVNGVTGAAPPSPTSTLIQSVFPRVLFRRSA